MRTLPADAYLTRPAARRWAALLALSVTFHVLVLGGFALRLPVLASYAEPQALDVTLVAPRYAPPVPPAAAPRPVNTRVAVLPTAPRFSGPPQAPTGEAGDAADLFGPVFADGRWPRPLLVSSEPCDPRDEPERLAACRRDLMLIGLASEPAAGSKAQP